MAAEGLLYGLFSGQGQALLTQLGMGKAGLYGIEPWHVSQTRTLLTWSLRLGLSLHLWLGAES